MDGDQRSRRVAVVPDAYVNPALGGNDRLVDLAEDGWGLVALPQPGLPADIERSLLTAIVDQVTTFLDDGYQVAVADTDDPMTERLLRLLAADGRRIDDRL
jgi:hypothetical protein